MGFVKVNSAPKTFTASEKRKFLKIDNISFEPLQSNKLLANFGKISALSSSSSSSSSKVGDFENNKPLEPCALTFLVTPLFSFLRFMLVFPSRFEFDPQVQQFKIHHGSRLRNMVALIILAVAMLHDKSGANYEEAEIHETVILVMHRLRHNIYLCYSVIYFYTLLTQGEKFREILSDVHQLYMQINPLDRRHKHKRNQQQIFRNWLFSTFLTAVFTIKGLHYVIVMSTPPTPSGYLDLFQLGDPNSTLNLSLGQRWANFYKCVGDAGFRQMWGVIFMEKKALQNYTLSMHWPEPLVIIWGVMYFYIGFMHAVTWLTGFLMQMLWSLLYWRLIESYYAAIKVDAESTFGAMARCMMKDVRQFLAISTVVEKYNLTFGGITLMGVLTGVIHFSFEIMKLFGHQRDPNELVAILTMLFLFSSVLLTATQVNQSATRIVPTIKERFQAKEAWRRFYGGNVELTAGISLIFHLLEDKRIGMRSSYGFFTISYSFIGSVVSVIMTYALINLQYQQCV